MNAKAEEMWRWMVPGEEKLLRVSGLTDQFFVDALTCYVITYNQQRTAANRLGVALLRGSPSGCDAFIRSVYGLLGRWGG